MCKAVVALILFGLCLSACNGSNGPSPGAAGIGDPYYDTLGNGGYDVEHYSIKLNVEPVANVVAGTTIIAAKATQSLSSLNLDLEGMNEPMASYLAAINIGEYILESMPGTEGEVFRSYFPPGFDGSRKQGYAKIPEMMAFFSDLFGPYPFLAYGVVIADEEIEWCKDYILHALENQTLSNHCPGALSGQERIVAHELAHQWFGNSVSLETWQDLWLKEGLATYAEWLWLGRDGGLDTISMTVDRQQQSYSSDAFIGQPPANGLYDVAVFTGGGLLIHALRLRVGEDAFFSILRTYASRFQYDNAGTDDFIEVAEEISGEELEDFFDNWLYSDRQSDDE